MSKMSKQLHEQVTKIIDDAGGQREVQRATGLNLHTTHRLYHGKNIMSDSLERIADAYGYELVLQKKGGES